MTEDIQNFQFQSIERFNRDKVDLPDKQGNVSFL